MRLKAAVSVILSVMLLVSPAMARGGHGHFGRMHMHGLGGSMAHGAGEGIAGGRRHADDAYLRAVSDENDRLLNTKLKSICRGC
jgi:hypothetical protein